MRISDWSPDVCSSDLSYSRPFIERLQRLAGGRVLQIFNHLHLDARRFLQDRPRVARRAAIGLVIDGRLHAPGTLIGRYPWPATPPEIGRAHVGNPVTKAKIVCRRLRERKKNNKNVE